MLDATTHPEATTTSKAESAILTALDLIRPHMGEGRHVVSLVELIEEVRAFEAARFNGDKEGMLDAAAGAFDRANDLHAEADRNREADSMFAGRCGLYAEEIGPHNAL